MYEEFLPINRKTIKNITEKSTMGMSQHCKQEVYTFNRHRHRGGLDFNSNQKDINGNNNEIL